jgi:hypothetical protein
LGGRNLVSAGIVTRPDKLEGTSLVAVKSGKLTSHKKEVNQKIKLNVKKQWKAFDLFTTEGLEMPIIRYLKKTRIGRNTGMVEAIPANIFKGVALLESTSSSF